MSIIESLKNLIGYQYSDMDMIFAMIGLIIIMFFVYTLFNILVSMFKRTY